MRQNLAVRQEKMRQKLLRQKEQLKERKEELLTVLPIPEGRTMCIHCKRRIARVGQVLCSRCTGKGVEQSLRSTLPGLPTNQKIPTDVAGYNYYLKTSSIPPPPPPQVEKKDAPPLLPSQVNGEITYTRVQVCTMLGISATTLSRWERKGKTPMPKRILHNNQCVYTDSIISGIREYMSQEYTPASHPNSTGARLPVGTKKALKINRQAERAVATRLGSRRRFI